MQGKSVSRTPKRTQAIRRMVITAMLAAITILLTFTPVGMITLPPPLAAVTMVHIPVLVAVLTEGPLVGLSVAFVFGVCSLIRAWGSSMVGLTLFFRNPLVSVLPRLIIPLTAWCVYKLWSRFVKKKSLADKIGAGVASAVGALTNTVLCLGAIVLLYGNDLNVLVNNLIMLGSADNAYMNNAGAWLVAAVGVPNGIAEIVVAAVLVPMIKAAVDAITRRSGRKTAGAPPTATGGVLFETPTVTDATIQIATAEKINAAGASARSEDMVSVATEADTPEPQTEAKP